MRTVAHAKPLIVVAGILLMLAHSVAPAPACTCSDPAPDRALPCHQTATAEPSSCCGHGPATPGDSCSPGLDATCCKRTVAPQEENPAAIVVSPDTPAAPDVSLPPAHDRSLARPPVVASTAAPPAPPGAPVWLRHATLLI